MSVLIDDTTYQLEPVDNSKSTWEVALDGHIVEDVRTLTVINRQMGVGFLYGKSPAGPYNQGRLVNRGGSVIVPTVEAKGSLYYLALSQVRPLVSPDSIWEFPRGQASPDESAIQTAHRELFEETGLQIPKENLTYLGRSNPDSALIHGANVHAWWLRLPAEFVVLSEGEKPSLRSDIKVSPESKLMENIRRAQLVAEHDFTSVSMMTSWAAGLVLQRIRHIEAVNRGVTLTA